MNNAKDNSMYITREERLIRAIREFVETMVYDVVEVGYDSAYPVQLTFRTKDGSNYSLLLFKEGSSDD